MANFLLPEWLEQIDPQMKQYSTELEKFGFGSLKTLRNIDGDDLNNYFPEILPGYKKALLEEARKLRTPVKVVDNVVNPVYAEAVSTKRQRQLTFVNNNSSASNSNLYLNQLSRYISSCQRISKLLSLSRVLFHLRINLLSSSRQHKIFHIT